jgi:putative endonuclease
MQGRWYARDNARMPATARPWFLYLLECADGSYYAGITTDVDARFAAHAAGKGARYTRAHRPLRVLASCAYPDRSSASRAEWALKQQPRGRKLAWFAASTSVQPVAP